MAACTINGMRDVARGPSEPLDALREALQPPGASGMRGHFGLLLQHAREHVGEHLGAAVVMPGHAERKHRPVTRLSLHMRQEYHIERVFLEIERPHALASSKVMLRGKGWPKCAPRA